jgi:hypothetical protein
LFIGSQFLLGVDLPTVEAAEHQKHDDCEALGSIGGEGFVFGCEGESFSGRADRFVGRVV